MTSQLHSSIKESNQVQLTYILLTKCSPLIGMIRIGVHGNGKFKNYR